MIQDRRPRSVLLVTTSYDRAPAYVETHLRQRGLIPFRFDTDTYPSTTTLTFDPAGDFSISNGQEVLHGSSISSIWYRRVGTPLLPDTLDAGEREFCEREARALLLGTLLSLDGRSWVSHPAAIWTAEFKPYQLAVAKRIGFRIPRTRMTNSPEEARRFASAGESVAKALSSGYVRREEGNAAIFTSLLRKSDLADMEDLALAPVTFQEHIRKTSDLRVTVIGEKVFAAELLSQERASSRVDWRATDDPDLVHRKFDLPPTIATQCVALVRQLNLSFGAIDLILADDGEIYFLEINPNGEWHWIEERLQYPIGAALASELDR